MEPNKKLSLLQIMTPITLVVAILWVLFALFWLLGWVIIGLFFSAQTGIAIWFAIPIALFGLFMGLFNAVVLVLLVKITQMAALIEEHAGTIEKNTQATAVILHHMQNKAE